MSIDEFLSHAAQLSFVKSNGHIRLAQDPGICPVSAVCNHLHGTEFYCHITAPARRMRLSVHDAIALAAAADGDKRQPELRQRLEALVK